MEISSDGREIWDAAKQIMKQMWRDSKIAKVKKQIYECGSTCGSCDQWMKSNMCPKEHNANGYNRGPSMNGIKCEKFVEAPHITEWRTELEIKLKTLMDGE